MRLVLAVLPLLFATGLRAAEVVTVTSVIYPGQQITADKIKVVALKRPAPQASPIARAPSDLLGLVARKTILPNRMIGLDAVREANIVEAGKPVRAIYQSRALSIMIVATALSNGAPGETVKLRNTASGRVFSGIAMPDGTVTVGTAP
jgi:flagellar basal body P-ring formation protein FlgA